MEDDHVVDLPPAMLAVPAVAALIVAYWTRGESVIVRIVRRTLSVHSVVKTGQDLWLTVAPRKHKGNGHL